MKKWMFAGYEINFNNEIKSRLTKLLISRVFIYVSFDSKDRIVRVEFDASRLKEPMVAALLRGAGVDIRDKLVLA